MADYQNQLVVFCTVYIQYLPLFTGGIESLRRLHTLKLSHNQLISTTGLNDTPTLQMIDMSSNHLQMVEDVSKLCLLQSLMVSSNNLQKVSSGWGHIGWGTCYKMWWCPPTIYWGQGHRGRGTARAQLNLNKDKIANKLNLTLLWYATLQYDFFFSQLPCLRNHVLMRVLCLDDNSITNLEDLQCDWLPLLEVLNLSQNR